MMHLYFQFFLFSLWGSVMAGATSGTVVVASGNTLHVHSSPSTSSSTLYDLSNGAIVDLTCYTHGDTISGSQGTTDQWDQIISNTYGTGYASHAYISVSGSISPCSTDDSSTAEVVVASGNTLKVHSSPSTSSTTLYSLRSP